MSYNYGSPAKGRQGSPLHHMKSPQYPNRSTSQTSNQVTTKKVPTSTDYPLEQSLMGEVDIRQRNQMLEQQLKYANTELDALKQSGKKTRDLDSRIDQVLKQNAQLMSENDNIQKQFSQKKTEVEIWKNKYETQMNSLLQLKANYEMDIQRMQKENENSIQNISKLSNSKNKETEALKQSMQQEGRERIEFIKQTHAKNAALYEEQLRKMKDIIEDREKEIQELSLKLNNVRNTMETENLRINEDRDQLRLRIQSLELKNSQDLEEQKYQLDELYEGQRLTMKKLHDNEIEVLQDECNKIRNLLNIKNEEIQALMNQNKWQRQNTDSETEELKILVQNLQDKIAEINREKEEEINDTKEKLATLHITDIQEIKLRNENLVDHLTGENQKLKDLLSKKAEELDNQIREKLEQREAYNSEVDRVKGELDKQRLQILVLQEETKKEQDGATQHLQEVQQAHEDHSNQLEGQIKFLEKEIDALKGLIVKKNNDTDRHISRSNTIQTNMDDDIRLLRRENDEWKQNYQNMEYEKEKLIEEYKQKLKMQEAVNTDNRRKLEARIDYMESELQKAEEALNLKQQENHNNIQLKTQAENDIRKLKQEIQQLKEQVLYIEKLKSKELEEQRVRIEASNENSIQIIKNSHQNQQMVLEQEIENLKRYLNQKDVEIQDMIQKYETLETAFTEFQASQDKLSDYEKKLQLLGSEIVTTKNLYDVFVKTKSRFAKKSSPEKQQQQSPYKY